jgi:hypothetical protein
MENTEEKSKLNSEKTWNGGGGGGGGRWLLLLLLL